MIPIVTQRNNYSCSEACVEAVLLHYGDKSKVAPFASSEDGASPRQIEYQLRIKKLNVIAGNLDWNQVKYWLRKKIPVIVCYDGHYVILIKTQNRSIIIMDPLHIEYRKIAISKFRTNWYDYDTVGTAYSNWGIVAYP
jgi:ABC-type bacteriocin/lantibiotic exporter with double-glycine peptidase domain